jgi:Heme exporter protein D (CcmD)
MTFAMTHAGYVAVAWGGTFLLVGGYAASLVARGRKLSRQVPPEDRRWS